MHDKSQFAGFWKRVGAYLIDSIIYGFVMAIVSMVLVAFLMIVMKQGKEAITGLTLILYALGLFGQLLYFSLFECSSKQATPGKMALGIVVTNMQGGRIGLGRAIGRNCAQLISGLFFGLGYIICGFTDMRQAAHDLIASTLVVNKDAPLRLGAKEEMQIMQSP